MNTVERIQAAIDKLEALKAEPQPQYLVSYEYDWVQDGNNDDLVEYVFPAGVEYGRREERDRTIDTQLAILERWLEYRPLAMEEPVVALADAILGATS